MFKQIIMHRVAFAIGLLCFTSVSESTVLTCEDLLRPVDQLDLRRLEGQWVLIAGGRSSEESLEKFKQSESATINFSPNTSDSTISYTLSIRLGNNCIHNSYNISLEGSSFTYDVAALSNHSGSFIHTSCKDCILWRVKVHPGEYVHVYLLSRRREVEQSVMEEFRTQVACMDVLPPVVMDPTKDLCPEVTATATARPDEKTDTKEKN